MKDNIAIFVHHALYHFVSCDCEVNQEETLMAECDFLTSVATKLQLKFHQPSFTDWEKEKYCLLFNYIKLNYIQLPELTLENIYLH